MLHDLVTRAFSVIIITLFGNVLRKLLLCLLPLPPLLLCVGLILARAGRELHGLQRSQRVQIAGD